MEMSDEEQVPRACEFGAVNHDGVEHWNVNKIGSCSFRVLEPGWIVVSVLTSRRDFNDFIT
jgi:hypothetical protein